LTTFLRRGTQRRILALDGGGIRGILTIAILKEVETQIRTANPHWPGLVLRDYFDFIGGTSTGAIIATALSLGMSADEVEKLYRGIGPRLFARAWRIPLVGAIVRFLSNEYRDEPLAQQLKNVTSMCDLGSDRLQNLLLAVTRNATTDSPWPLTNNPRARYNRVDRAGCNLKLPLWQIIRASTAAPHYFPPEQVMIDNKMFSFVDGGITPYNNPAFLMYRMATHPSFRLEWPTGEDRIMLVSVGTGSAPELMKLGDRQSWLWQYGPKIPSAMMYAMSVDQDIACRTVGRCVHGDILDQEMNSLMPLERSANPDERGTPILTSTPLGRAFLYARYNVELTERGLTGLGLDGARSSSMRQLDAIDMINDLFDAGRLVAKRDVNLRSQFPTFLTPTHLRAPENLTK
jgi:uncharacterized protein